MLVSSIGLDIAASAARTARSSPLALPIPISAVPAPCITDRTSAKSTLISPGTAIRSVIPCTPERKTSSAIMKASTKVTERFSISSKRWFGTTIKVSTSVRKVSMPASACAARRGPSNENGRVTTPTVRAPVCLAILATTGAPPVPVPPPSPAVTNTMSAPRRTASISST